VWNPWSLLEWSRTIALDGLVRFRRQVLDRARLVCARPLYRQGGRLTSASGNVYRLEYAFDHQWRGQIDQRRRRYRRSGGRIGPGSAKSGRRAESGNRPAFDLWRNRAERRRPHRDRSFHWGRLMGEGRRMEDPADFWTVAGRTFTSRLI